MHNNLMNKEKIDNKQLGAGFLAGAIIVALISIAYSNVQAKKEKATWLSEKTIKAKATNYINSELIQQGKASVSVVGKEGDMYKLEVDYNGQKIPSYISKDGKRFFPQVMDIAGGKTAKDNSKETKADSEPVADVVEEKSDKPKVELFVMSHCPYGLQMEKGIIPVVRALGNKIDFKIKFNDYAMHGEKELKEELSQYCIQKEQQDKYLAYLGCFTKDGDSGVAGCLDSAKIDKNKLESCISKTEEEFKVLDNFNNKIGFKGQFAGFEIFKADNEKYSVGGSPTLIINGSQSDSGRDSKSLLKSICSAFNNQPKECSIDLSDDAPAPGFGAGAASAGGSGSGGGCGQ